MVTDYIIVAVLTLLVLALVWLFKKWPDVRLVVANITAALPRYILQLNQNRLISDRYARVHYDAAAAIHRISSNPESFGEEKGEEFMESVSAVVSVLHLTAFDPSNRTGMTEEQIKRFSKAIQMLVWSNEDIAVNFRHVVANRFQDIEVKKVTLVFIDVLGQLFDLENDLDVEFFQHVIYALNLVLLQLRDSGTSTKAIKEIGRVLFRLYKLTKAYGYLKSTREMTPEEFYEKVKRTIGVFSGS